MDGDKRPTSLAYLPKGIHMLEMDGNMQGSQPQLMFDKCLQVSAPPGLRENDTLRGGFGPIESFTYTIRRGEREDNGTIGEGAADKLWFRPMFLALFFNSSKIRGWRADSSEGQSRLLRPDCRMRKREWWRGVTERRRRAGGLQMKGEQRKEVEQEGDENQKMKGVKGSEDRSMGRALETPAAKDNEERAR
ncbi:hypothetical protein AMTR_s00131p00020190 [Amborella trichopoda]|uniref:Uncharacterized protein n=1 Tax=Amborella trichopoda TaxID=13333 RepID=W1NVL8_AMBTC|nr:hypothetical protein AMTR_s00131p00020190 [Amborella trichopoda]